MQRLIALFTFAAALSVSVAQTSSSPSDTSPADQAWQAVKDLGQSARAPGATAAARAQAIAQYISAADALKTFYSQYPQHADAHDAMRREAIALLNARALGDTSQAARCQMLVNTVRKDPTIEVESREEVVAFSDYLDVRDRKITSGDALVLAHEQNARALQAEFPSSKIIYESLLGIAQSSPDTRALALAKDILKMPASDHIKAGALILISRLGLTGTSLAEIAKSAIGADNPIARADGQPLVVYSWSSSAPVLMEVVKQLAANAPSGARFVGVCVDMGNVTSAHATATAEQLPGEQIYDPMGFAGRFAGRIYLTSPGLLYVADRKGVIVSVSERRDRRVLLKTLSSL